MILFYLYLFILGLVLGSFYNVVGLRVPENVSIARPGSHCPACHRTLGKLDLVPVFSYLFLRGKCRGCGKKISMIYPAVELITGLLFMLAGYQFGLGMELAVALTLISLLMIIFVSDLFYMVIPDKVLIIFIPLVSLERIILPLDPWWDMLAGAFTGFALLYVIIIISKGGMGAGDAKLFFVIGLVFGLELTLLSLVAAIFIGAAYGILGMSLDKFKKNQAIPFGPFIAAGALISLFVGDALINWYLNISKF